MYRKNSNKRPSRLKKFLNFLLWHLLDAGSLKEAGAYLIFRKLKNIIISNM